MRALFTLLFISFGLLTGSCNQNDPTTDPNMTVVEGTLTDFTEGQMVYLDEFVTGVQQPIPRDTGVIDNEGNYQLSTTQEKTNFFRLRIADNNFLVLILKKGEKVTLNASIADMARTYTVVGSPESIRFQQFQNIKAPLDSLSMALQDAQRKRDFGAMQAVNQSRDQVVSVVRKGLHDFIDEEPGSVASMAAVQTLSMDQDLDYFDKVITAISTSYPELAEYYDPMKAQVESIKRLGIGREAPDINLQSPDGNYIALSSLRGKVVLIDFWASWCKPCRMENPNVRRMYDKYKNKGFEIYGVSLDQKKDKWIQAIAQDQLPWKHVSDLGGWQSSVTPVYNVSSIPQTYLIDEEGKIMAKNLRGPSLESKLAEIFGG